MIRVAVIGAGIFVRETYIPQIQSFRFRIKLTAILSRSEESVNDTLALLSEGRESVLKFIGEEGENVVNK